MENYEKLFLWKKVTVKRSHVSTKTIRALIAWCPYGSWRFSAQQQWVGSIIDAAAERTPVSENKTNPMRKIISYSYGSVHIRGFTL